MYSPICPLTTGEVLYKLPADLAKFLAFEALKSTGREMGNDRNDHQEPGAQIRVPIG